MVVGGDGTVGWILSALDELQQQATAAAWASVAAEAVAVSAAAAGGEGVYVPTVVEPKPWRQPPVAVMPMGTGERQLKA